ncbi:ABC transporter substrate-binding protein [Streptomyces sp. XM4193]|uniref:ABC transporter substrate-binding protein n=1 Tax=Streptomyces sp. XM4193 TaxID=2929782 RepID=UPI001FF7E355|nr:ABC transporter substrate-binding protein [Streptomyces sp. XM4193]MCK1798055.1 ABC transporter substrate-binding protein [Streptomyces sp. XM4193]
MSRSHVTRLPLARRQLLGGLTATAAVLGLSACGVSGSGDQDGDSAKSDGGDGGGTRKVKADNGTIEVPVDPQRIVVLENYDALMLVELGIVPVGVPDGAAAEKLMPAEIYEKLKGVKTIGASGSPNSQAIAALEPDLIIDQFWKDKSAGLKKIAPVVYFDWHTSGSLWHEQIAKIAGAVGREDRLTKLKKRYEARLEEVQKNYRKQIDSTKWISLSGGPNGKFFIGTPMATVMRDVGLTMGAGLPDKEAGFVTKSYEEIEDLRDCDGIIYSVQYDDRPTPPTQALLDHKLWKQLPTVKGGRAFPSKHFLMANYTFALGAVDEIEAALKKV